MQRRCHMPFGASVQAEGGVLFRLWAPAARQVVLDLEPDTAGDERTRIAATPAPGGWWAVLSSQARPGTRYRFEVDGLAVPDPASRFNPLGPHGASEVIDPSAFVWEDAGWTGRPWHEVVLYELHVGSFTREGTFAAAQAQLAALAQLGITALQIMPLADFPGRFGWGYDGVLHFAPHAAYGRPDDFKRLVQAAHALGLMVFVDVVYNHFGPDGNYLHAYAPQFFSAEHDSPWGRAINFDGEGSRTVRDFFIGNALYWLEEFHVDGLRLDAVHAIVDSSTPDVLDELAARVRARLPGRQVHLVVEDDHNTPGRWGVGEGDHADTYAGQWAGDFHHLLHVLLTGEAAGYYAEFTHDPLTQLARCLTRGVAWRGLPPSGHPAGLGRGAASETEPLGAVVNFLQNHDQVGNRAFGERLPALVAAKRGSQAAAEAPLRLATALLLLAPHTPMLFMGQEWNAHTPFLYFAAWQGALRDAVTEGRRREFAQFHDAAAAEKIPGPCDAATFQACVLKREEAATPQGRTWMAFTAHLLALRRRAVTPRLPQLSLGGHTAQGVGGRGLQVAWQFGEGRALSAVLNFSDAPLEYARAENRGDGAPLFTVGDVSAGTLGPWAGEWRWMENAA